MLSAVVALWLLVASTDGFQIGVGIYDITGATAEIGMMGYAKTGQTTAGIHFRQRARAFVLIDEQTNTRIALVSVDSCMVFFNVKVDIINRLQSLYGNVYTHDNVVISAIHNHAGPGGFAPYTLYDVTSWGFENQTYEAMVNGTVEAIKAAHASATSNAGAKVSYAWGDLVNSSISRSAPAYVANPAWERALYNSNIDTQFHFLRFDSSSGVPLGSASVFSVHCTSMNNSNQLISGDNKGYASYLMEAAVNAVGTLPGVGPYVAAFFSANLGDVSPNIQGSFCPDGTPCDPIHSTCNGTNAGCQGLGPGGSDFIKSTQIIGSRQTQMAQQLAQDPSLRALAQGGLAYRSMFWSMVNQTVPAEFTSTNLTGLTCAGALGRSFAAGTSDGPGAFSFEQGDNSSSGNPLWDAARDFIKTPSQAQIDCHAPKPILLDVGEISGGIPGLLGKQWVTATVPIQLIRISTSPITLLLAAVPGEFTTMSGRRLRRRIASTYAKNSGGLLKASDVTVVIIGLSNEYAGYIATYEEYQVQRYEAASTLHGPHTLARYEQGFALMAASLASGAPLPPTDPPTLPDPPMSFITPVIVDEPPLFKSFGDVITDAKDSYRQGDVVTVSFWGGHPRNNLMTQSNGYMTVDELQGNAWQVIANDGNWETTFHWERSGIASSIITLTWTIPEAATVGSSYRLVHHGVAKTAFSGLESYQGLSRTFTISAV